MVKTDFPVLYLNAKINIPIIELVEEIIPKLSEWKIISLVTTIQHTHQLKDLANSLNMKGIKTIIGKGNNTTIFDGQILGCNFFVLNDLPEEVDGIVYIGGGNFHPLGLSISTGKPVLIANPYNLKISLLNESDVMLLAKKRMAALTISKNAKKIGILVSSKPGQNSLIIAEEMMDKLTKKGITSFLIYLDEIKAETLNNFSEVDAFLDTACPRIAIDGIMGVEKPIITIQEMRIVLGELKWAEVWGRNYISF